MSQEQRRLGVAIIGCGYWGGNYVRVFNELVSSRVVVVCDQRQERLNAIGARYPDVLLTTQLGEALAVKGVDVVVVSTTATSHFAIARACLAAGKHVLIEKPMATMVADAKALINLAASKRLTLMVGHTFLYNASVHKMKETIARADMGDVYYLYGRRTNLGPIRYDVNAIWDLAPHDVSIFNYLLDRQPQWVSAVGASVLNNTRADVGFITLGYGRNVVGNIHVSWADPNKVRELVVVGSEKRIVFNDLSSQEPVKIYEKGIAPADESVSTFGEAHFRMRDGDIISPHINFTEPLKNQCRHFLQCVVEGKQPLTDGRSGLEVVRIMVAIERSRQQNGAPVAVTATTAPLNGGLRRSLSNVSTTP